MPLGGIRPDGTERDRRGKRHAERRSRTRLTRRGRFLAWTGGVLVVLVLGAAGAGFWAHRQLDGNVTSADLEQHLDGDRPEDLSSCSKNILVVGSDSCAGANAKYSEGLGTMQSDTLMVVLPDPVAHCGYAVRVCSSRVRWLVRVRSKGRSFHQAFSRIRLSATAE